MVRAAGGVNLQATGTGTNTGSPSTTSYTDGTAGVAAAVNVSNNNIQSNADGMIVSGVSGALPGTAAPALPTLTINPFTDIDFANNAIILTPQYMAQLDKYASLLNEPPGNLLQTGQQFVYNSGGGGAIRGLISGTTYYIIVPSSPANEIQLADTFNDAMAGDNIAFGQYPTLSGLVSGQTVTVPITDIDETTGTIDFGFNPGFTNGESLVYTPLAGQNIGGLVTATVATPAPATYYAVFNSASPNTLQLAATQSAQRLHLRPLSP